ncbi:MAG: T9SS type A sorting domain-containing protein, partial [Bacteroidales bacterium]|nr:T9SS type A sorting domain-containing protein [Bacteroidales bacterium]
IGDTVTLNNVISGPTITMKVIDIDSILINDDYRKQFHFEPVNWPFWDTWVEGIGSMGQGIIYSGWYNTSPWYTLLCYKQNDIVYYMHPDYTACYYPYVSVDETPVDKLKVFYNNKTKCVDIKNNGANSPTCFELYTVFGQRIFHEPITGNAQINLSKYGLADGLYIYSVKNKKYFNNGKLIITKNL